MLRMDQVHVIRHKVLREGASIRQVARELGLSRNTVSKYLDESVPVKDRGRLAAGRRSAFVGPGR
jgi:predicted transcriptional regulator